MRTVLRKILLALLLAMPYAAVAEQGPMQHPLRVIRMYTGDASDRIYIQFNPGAMPGCYADSGGRLYVDDVFFEAIYSQILTMIATGGVAGSVVFENQAGPGWSICRIKGLDLRP